VCPPPPCRCCGTRGAFFASGETRPFSFNRLMACLGREYALERDGPRGTFRKKCTSRRGHATRCSTSIAANPRNLPHLVPACESTFGRTTIPAENWITAGLGMGGGQFVIEQVLVSWMTYWWDMHRGSCPGCTRKNAVFPHIPAAARCAKPLQGVPWVTLPVPSLLHEIQSTNLSRGFVPPAPSIVLRSLLQDPHPTRP